MSAVIVSPEMVNLLIHVGNCACQLKLHDLRLFGSLFQITAKIRIDSTIKFLLIYFVAGFMMFVNKIFLLMVDCRLCLL